MFDPFFTTKPVGHGTGLGLDLARRVVQFHHGDLDFTSEPGRTVFRVAPVSGPAPSNAVAIAFARLRRSSWTSRSWLLALSSFELALPIDVADAVRNPRRRGLVLQVVSEPLDDPPVVVDLVRLLA